jgi:hypothetical protein
MQMSQTLSGGTTLADNPEEMDLFSGLLAWRVRALRRPFTCDQRATG